MHGSKINSASIFVSHKSHACIFKAFVCISFGLCLKNNDGFHIVHCKANR
jgi:hypothetical protein